MEHLSAPMLAADGTLHGRVWYFRDITQRRRGEEKRQKLESQLLHAQRIESVGQLAGGIAHDFNNLLTPIIGYTELIADSFPPDDSRLEMLQTVRTAADRAKVLAKQLLAFSRKQVLEMRQVNLGPILEHFEKILRRTIRENIQISMQIEKNLREILADSGQIEQIVMNLSVNAQDAMPTGGTLSISLENLVADQQFAEQHIDLPVGEYVRLSVSDTGTGIPKDLQAHVFEPFFTTKETGKGTGLGLSTVYGIVKQHGGQIFLYSEPGHGTTFRLYFPAVCAKTAAARSETEVLVPLSNRRNNETIMVVEDSDLIRELICRVLKKLGYQVIESSGAETCFDLAKRHAGPIHLLLTDVVMPNMNGKEVYEELRLLRPQIKVIFMSGYARDVIAHHGVLDQGTQYLAKPFTLQQLEEKIRTVLDLTAVQEPTRA